MLTDIIVKKSKIQGKGVFAIRNFKKGEIVIKWGNFNKLTKKQIEVLPKKEKKYVLCFNGTGILIQQIKNVKLIQLMMLTF